jgi:hypothetical protein
MLDISQIADRNVGFDFGFKNISPEHTSTHYVKLSFGEFIKKYTWWPDSEPETPEELLGILEKRLERELEGVDLSKEVYHSVKVETPSDDWYEDRSIDSNLTSQLGRALFRENLYHSIDLVKEHFELEE